MATICIENLRKEFGTAVAVKDLNLTINDKELMVFLGPSGCGKTTTLNCIAGLEMPTSGKIYFDDEDITDYPPHVRNISMVFQSSLVYPHLTARRNIEMSLRKSKLSKQEVKERIDEAAKLLHIEPLLDKMPSQISGGERQRVATAKAIVRKPEVFLMDEPLASLDAALRETLRVELVKVQKSLGVTMVFVTHDQVEAMTMGDRIAVMKDGAIQQVGAPEDVYNKPSNLFIAGFVGSPPMNFIEGTLKATEGKLIFTSDELNMPIANEVFQHLENYVNKSFIVGVRPQHMDINVSSDEGALSVVVFGIERLGKELIVIAEHGEKKNRYKAIASPTFKVAAGDRIYMRPRSADVHYFDIDTGKNIILGS